MFSVLEEGSVGEAFPIIPLLERLQAGRQHGVLGQTRVHRKYIYMVEENVFICLLS